LIDQVIAADRIVVEPQQSTYMPPQANPVQSEAPKLSVRNGWLVLNDRIVTGSVAGVPWWNARVRPPHISKQAAITRFVPGKEGTGFTDYLAAVAESMAASNTGGLVQHPPLWYERRRDDHQRVRRSDPEVVAPFYEWPFARSGPGTAYDGLSKWDLTKPNHYYYLRLREFSQHAAASNVVLFNAHYMQHNILEAGAHYADFPWRPANNINDTALPEPVAYAGDKLIYIGETFYDVQNNAKLRDLHRQYIRTQLDQLKDSPNVVHLTSEEFTGSLAFTQFWVDTIAEWEKETGRDAIVGLYAPKDVTDAILADAERSRSIEVIFNRFNTGDAGFWYSGDKLYAPPGGKNLAPRQWQRQGGTGNASTADVVRMVNEYRSKYPDKAFVYTGSDLKEGNWLALLAGVSMPKLQLDEDVASALLRMRPMGDGTLADGTNSVAIYVTAEFMKVPTEPTKQYRKRYINPASGALINAQNPQPPYILWLEEAK
jgi:hypothetical protein